MGERKRSAGTSRATAVYDQLFPGQGEMATRMRALDWSTSPLGPAEDWPSTRRTAITICLTARVPIVLWCGPDLRLLYNDAYRSILGDKKNSTALGAPGHEVWSEVWDVVGPRLEEALRSGGAPWSDGQMLPVSREDYIEEAYFEESYSPIYDNSGDVDSLYCFVEETTRRTLGDRRAQLACDVAAAVLNSQSTAEVCTRAAQVLMMALTDIPFALLYAIDQRSEQAVLLSTTSLVAGTALSQQTVSLQPAKRQHWRERDPWSCAQVSESNLTVATKDIAWARVERGVRPDVKAHDALTLPLSEPGFDHPTCVLVAGISPRSKLDAEYCSFYEALQRHLSTALAAVQTRRTELRAAAAETRVIGAPVLAHKSIAETRARVLVEDGDAKRRRHLADVLTTRFGVDPIRGVLLRQASPHNQLLSAVPSEELERLRPRMRPVELGGRQTIQRAVDPVGRVYFPTTAVVSLMNTLRNGSMTELGLVGNEGVTGLGALLDCKAPSFDTVVRIPGAAIQMPTALIMDELHAQSALGKLLQRYIGAYMIQVEHRIACTLHHTVQQRIASYFLMLRDRVGPVDLRLTHDDLAQALGVGRPSVTLNLDELKSAGVVQLGRGSVAILDWHALATVACECYGDTQEGHGQLLS